MNTIEALACHLDKKSSSPGSVNAETAARLRDLRDALSELSAVYTSCFDLVDGGLIILPASVERFEKANAAARKALGFNDVSFEDEN